MIRTHNIRRPNLFLVGAAKCGTTSMAHYLGEHPKIFMVPGEPRFFGTDVPVRSKRLSEQEYLCLFSEACHEEYLGEKSPMYLHSTRAAEEIGRFNPEARILIMLRNPVDMVYSLHGQLAYKSFREDIRDFEQALDAEWDRKLGKRLPKHNWHPGVLFYSQIARYTEQVKRFYRFFDESQIHIVIFDDFVADTFLTYKKVLDFLKLENHFRPPFRIHNPGVTIKNITLQKYLRLIAQRIIVLKEHFPPPLVKVLKPVYHAINNTNTSTKPRPPMPEHVRNRLRRIYADEIASLSAFLGRDLSHWKR